MILRDNFEDFTDLLFKEQSTGGSKPNVTRIALENIKVTQVFKTIWKNIPFKREFTVIKLSDQATQQKGKKMTDKKAINLEKSLGELEALVEKLEDGSSSLDKSLSLFEKGVSLYKDCKKELDVAEKKISKLTKSLKEEDLG